MLRPALTGSLRPALDSISGAMHDKPKPNNPKPTIAVVGLPPSMASDNPLIDSKPLANTIRGRPISSAKRSPIKRPKHSAPMNTETAMPARMLNGMAALSM